MENNIAHGTNDIGKKKPGRPKKKVVVTHIEIQGIVTAPVNQQDVVELVYCNPTLFKKLFQLYKAYEVSEIEMNFDHVGVKIITTDHFKNSTIYTMIEGKCMNLYYCKNPIRVCIKRDNLERVLSTLGKSHYKITIMLRENYRSTMYIITRDTEYNNDDMYEIDVIFKPDEQAPPTINDDDTNYPIKFRISSKYFKTKINNIKKLSADVFTIQKCSNEPLQFTFDKTKKGIYWVGVYPDSDKMCLKSTINDDDIFNVSVAISNIQPFSNSNIGDELIIAAHKSEKMSFMTYLDKKDSGYACIVKIFTKINEYRGAI